MGTKKTTKIQTAGVLVEVRDSAEQNARNLGFNSLQDAIRVFVVQLANDQISLGAFRPQYELSDRMINDYMQQQQQLDRDLATGKARSYANMDDLRTALENE